MRRSPSLHALALLALGAGLLAACQDAPTAAPLAPDASRLDSRAASMLPLQPNGLRYQIIRPRDYARFGIPPVSVEELIATRKQKSPQTVFVSTDRCETQIIKDPECEDTSPRAIYAFGSHASDPVVVASDFDGAPVKQLTLMSFSEAFENVAFFTLDANFYSVGGCGNTPGRFDGSHQSMYGLGRLEASVSGRWRGEVHWAVGGVHYFEATPGALGTKTEFSSDSECG